MKDEKNQYRCTTREEMAKLIVAGFNYTNFRKDRFNDGNFTYYFERTKELDDYLASTARVQKKVVKYGKKIFRCKWNNQRFKRNYL